MHLWGNGGVAGVRIRILDKKFNSLLALLKVNVIELRGYIGVAMSTATKVIINTIYMSIYMRVSIIVVIININMRVRVNILIILSIMIISRILIRNYILIRIDHMIRVRITI